MKKVRTGEERDTSNVQKTKKQTERADRKFNAEMDAESAKLAKQADDELAGRCFYCPIGTCKEIFLTERGRRDHQVNCSGGRVSKEEHANEALRCCSAETWQKLMELEAQAPEEKAVKRNCSNMQCSKYHKDHNGIRIPGWCACHVHWELVKGWANHETEDRSNERWSVESKRMCVKMFDNECRVEAADGCNLMKSYFHGGVGFDYCHRKSVKQLKSFFSREKKRRADERLTPEEAEWTYDFDLLPPLRLLKTAWRERRLKKHPQVNPEPPLPSTKTKRKRVANGKPVTTKLSQKDKKDWSFDTSVLSVAALSNMRVKWRHHRPSTAAGSSTTAQGPTATKRITATKRPSVAKRATTTKSRIDNPTATQKQVVKPTAARQRQGPSDQEQPEKRQKKSAKKNIKPTEVVTGVAVQPRVNRDGTKKCILCHKWLPVSKLNKKEECLDKSACTKQKQAGLGKRVRTRKDRY